MLHYISHVVIHMDIRLESWLITTVMVLEIVPVMTMGKLLVCNLEIWYGYHIYHTRTIPTP